MLPNHTVNIGKNGLSQNVISEINMTLKHHREVRVKLLKSFAVEDVKSFFKDLEKDLEKASLVRTIGKTAIFKRK